MLSINLVSAVDLGECLMWWLIIVMHFGQVHHGILQNYMLRRPQSWLRLTQTWA